MKALTLRQVISRLVKNEGIYVGEKRMKKVEKDKRNLVQSEWKKIARSEENVKILHTEDDDSARRESGISRCLSICGKKRLW